MKKALIVYSIDRDDDPETIRLNTDEANIGSSVVLFDDQQNSSFLDDFKSRYPQVTIEDLARGLHALDADISTILTYRFTRNYMDKLMEIYSSQDIHIIIILEKQSDRFTKAHLSNRINNQLVKAAAKYVDGKSITPSLESFWLAFKFQKEMTRPSDWNRISTIEGFIDNCSDGIVNWVHLIDEIAFLLGLAPKYGA